jgi:hypothetical protein
VRFDLLSQCLQLEMVKDFIASFRPEPSKTAPALSGSGRSLADSLVPPLPSKTAAAAAPTTPPPAAATATPAPADGQEWAKLVALKKAMSETVEELLGSLVQLHKQTVACADVGQAHAIARLAMGLKAVVNGTIDASQVEFVRKVEPSSQPPTAEELSNISHLRGAAEVVLDETRAWLAVQKRALQSASDLSSAVRVGRGVNLLRKLVDAYQR